MTEFSIAPGIYRHYKGKNYFVLGLSKDTETNEVYVVYRPLYDTTWSHLFHRSAQMFLEHVTIDGETMPRFKMIS